MAILIDADVLIDAERGSFDLLAWMNAQPEEDFLLAAITVAELRHGVERATDAHRAARTLFFDRIVSTFETVPYTDATAKIHARIWAELESSGRLIGAHDLILAATALEHTGAIATFNTRHFASVPGLTVVLPANE